MDPTNPRWDTSEVRYRRQKLFWSLIAGGAATLAASTMIVVSCLGRGQERHQPAPLTIVETTAAQAPAPSAAPATSQPVTQAAPATAVVVVPAAANDSTGGTNDRTGTTNVTAAPLPQRALTTAPPGARGANGEGAVVLAPPVAVPPAVRQPTDTSSGLPQQPVAPAAGAAASPTAPSLSPTTSPQANSTQAAPSPTQGAGRFITDSPPNSGSSFASNPEAGAGAFPGPQ